LTHQFLDYIAKAENDFQTVETVPLSCARKRIDLNFFVTHTNCTLLNIT
jgi:hypothetical protein